MDSGKHGKNWTEIWFHHHFVVVEYAVDGSEDELIHCFKESQPWKDRAERLRVLASTIDDNQENPFENVKDSDVDDAAPVLAVLESDGEDDELIDVE